MIRAILFDMGGTLDGDGGHWLERFLALYRRNGVDLPRETIRSAFDEAERLSSRDANIQTADLNEMIRMHVQWQLAELGITDAQLEERLIAGFVEPVRQCTAANVELLATLAKQGFELGVVSNGCGNVDKLCADFGYAPFLSLVVDSRWAGVSKPDPAIYRLAAEQLRLSPEEIMMAGDSFERDIRPAKQIGMKTAWLACGQKLNAADASLVDLHLGKLADLPAALAAPSLAPA